MKVTVLGYYSPYPGPGQTGPGFLLEHHSKYYLIDAGSGVLSKLQQIIDLHQLEGVFISHLHHDHMSDLLVMQYAVQMQFLHDHRTKPLPVYFPKEPKEIADLIPYKHFIEPHYIDEAAEFLIEDMKITFQLTDHPVPCYAIKFETKNRLFVYGADSGTKTVWSPFADEADLLILESSYLERNKPAVSSGHLSTSDVVQISNMLNVKQLLVTHLYPSYDIKEVKDELTGFGLKAQLYIPELGKVVEV